MLDYKRSFIRRLFLHLLFLLLTFDWWHFDAVTDKLSRLLHRVHKVRQSLSQENLTSRNLQNCNYQQQMHANFVYSAETAQNIENLVGFLKGDRADFNYVVKIWNDIHMN